MAGKHSKSIFDFRKSPYAPTKQKTKIHFFDNLSLTFKIALSAFVLVLTVSTIIIGVFFMQGNSHGDILSEAKEIFYSTDSSTALKNLASQNPDIKGWLRIEGTQIDCAVCQSSDDRYYIDHNQLKEKSRYGALFLQSNDSINREKNDKNIVIFGNNMNDETMFGQLKKYTNLNFYKSNPTIELYYGDKLETYAIFSVMLTSSASDDEGQIYKPYKSHFIDDAEFDGWFNEAKTRSMINTTVEAENGDNILTLVTVADDFEGARLVVMAKQIDPSDTDTIDVYNASVNQNPKHPKIWYTNRGLEYPY